MLTVRETVATRLAGIFETADHLSHLLIVCGQRGRVPYPVRCLAACRILWYPILGAKCSLLQTLAGKR